MKRDRKALVIGINEYQHCSNLFGCVNDAIRVKEALERNADGTKNFDVKIKIAKASPTSISKRTVKKLAVELFKNEINIALFYFSGHGWMDSTGGYLVTPECEYGDNGLSLNELMTIANHSPAKHKIIILDCCHSGILGSLSPSEKTVSLVNGITLLTASSKDQYAREVNGAGIFTGLMIDALEGGAANLLGQVTPSSVYAHIDQALGEWEQRPYFKTSVSNFTVLRQTHPPITHDNLLKIIDFFKFPDIPFYLSPTYEETHKAAKPECVAKFKILQKYARLNLVIPVDAEHMYFAAVNRKSCKLTLLGQHYWRLVKKERI